MKMLAILALLLSAQLSLAQVAPIQPVGTPILVDTATTNITTSYVQLVASLGQGCSAVMVKNTGAQPILLGTGAAASEVSTGLLFPTSDILLPVRLKGGVRLAAKSLGTTQSTGLLSISCFQ